MLVGLFGETPNILEFLGLMRRMIGAVIADLRNKYFHFTGSYHQHGRFGVPVLIDGKQYSVSLRHWGRLMAEAWGIKGIHAYLT